MAEVAGACRLQDHLRDGRKVRRALNDLGWAPELTGMDGTADEAFGRWRAALLDSLVSPERVLAWQDRRYRFAHQVGQLLTSPARSDAARIAGHVVYGVYVAGAGLLYVGQTGDANRRLRDLPVGESHHLATTVPPEIWERVIVVQWPGLLSGVRGAEGLIAEQLGHETCGLALEHLLQVTYRPGNVCAPPKQQGGMGHAAHRLEPVPRRRQQRPVP
jgi:hypothetical protein